MSATTELEEAIEAKCLGQDSGVSFGRPILEGTDSIPDLQGTPTVNNQVITLIQSFKVVTGKSLTVSQAEDIKKACNKQLIPGNLLEFLSVDLGWGNLNKHWDQHPSPPEITPPEFVSSQAVCITYYKILLAPKSNHFCQLIILVAA